jgi:hypothetical protein
MSRQMAVCAVKTASAATGNGHGEKHDSQNDLLQSGARFLSGLGDMMAKSEEPMGKRLQTMIGRDGEHYGMIWKCSECFRRFNTTGMAKYAYGLWFHPP